MYISFDNVKNNKIISSIKHSINSVKIFIVDKNEDKKEIKKSKIIVCSDNIDDIAYYLNLGKIVIAYNANKKNDNVISKNGKLYTYKNSEDLIDILLQLKYPKKKFKKIKIVVMLFCLLCWLFAIYYRVGINCDNLDKKEKENINTKKIDLKKENIVFFGDSITDYYDLEKFYDDYPVINSGTAGYQTKDLLDKIDEQVIIYNPTRVFILIGTNDIAFTDLSDKEIADNIIEIANKIKDKRKFTKIYIEAIYPVSKEDNEIVQEQMVGNRDNERIKNINKMVKEMCIKEKFTFVDTYKLLINDNDNIDEKYTADGLHLSDEGYKLVTKELKKYINE